MFDQWLIIFLSLWNRNLFKLVAIINVSFAFHLDICFMSNLYNFPLSHFSRKTKGNFNGQKEKF